MSTYLAIVYCDHSDVSVFSAGPFRYVDTVGASQVVAEMQKLEASYGELFSPCQMLIDMAKDPSKKFHQS